LSIFDSKNTENFKKLIKAAIELNEYLNDYFIIDIRCGIQHTLVLTNNGEVFAWSYNFLGQIEKDGDNECFNTNKS
jgi:alpha-tubulin suppressor-like RCC1 family protein